jgi:hypothetical protein
MPIISTLFYEFRTPIDMVAGSTYEFCPRSAVTDPIIRLAKADSALNAGKAWTVAAARATVEVDAGLSESVTRFVVDKDGTLWSWIGVSQDHARNQGLQHPQTDLAGDAVGHELQKVIYWPDTGDQRARRHYYGFHAEIIKLLGESSALVAVYDQGSSKIVGQNPAAYREFDFSNVSEVDLQTPAGYTEIAPEGPTTGALFIDRTLAQKLELRMPKLPPSSGGDPIP